MKGEVKATVPLGVGNPYAVGAGLGRFTVRPLPGVSSSLGLAVKISRAAIKVIPRHLDAPLEQLLGCQIRRHLPEISLVPRMGP